VQDLRISKKLLNHYPKSIILIAIRTPRSASKKLIKPMKHCLINIANTYTTDEVLTRGTTPTFKNKQTWPFSTELISPSNSFSP
jgi:hypothetical protein